MLFLAQVALVGVVVVLVTGAIHLLLKERWERAISKTLDFDQKPGGEQ